MEKKHILILGADGQLGTELYHLLKEKHQVVPWTKKDYDVLSSDTFSPPDDLDYIINCVAYTDTQRAEEEREDCQRLNAHLPKVLSEYCNEFNVTLIHFSTDFAFDGEKSTPYLESDTASPINYYGLSKSEGDTYILSNSSKFYIFRVSSLYGRYGKNNFVKTMIKKSKELNHMKIVDDIEMAPTHTLDVARAVDEFLIRDDVPYGMYNLSNRGSCTWFGFAKEIFQQSQIDIDLSPVDSESFPSKIKRPKYTVLDLCKISKFVEIKPWEDSLKEFFNLKDPN